MSDLKTHKLILMRNPRFLILMGLLISLFCTSLFFYYLLSSLILLGLAVLSIFVFSYILINKRPLFSQQITIYDDRIEYKRSRFETSTIFFRSLTCAGPFKKKTDNPRFSFSDALYLYEEESDRYLLVRSGFSEFELLLTTIEERCKKYKNVWQPIKRSGRNSLINGIRTIINQ